MTCVRGGEGGEGEGGLGSKEAPRGERGGAQVRGEGHDLPCGSLIPWQGHAPHLCVCFLCAWELNTARGEGRDPSILLFT
jgi:hypothetical protein